jgi:hypothetical protein
LGERFEIREMALPHPWTMLDTNSSFKDFETQPEYYQRWLAYRGGKGHALAALARSVALTIHLKLRKVGRQEDPRITLNDLCDYLWPLEKDPFDALKTAVEYNNFSVAEYIYKRLGPLSDERHCLLANMSIESDAADDLVIRKSDRKEVSI